MRIAIFCLFLLASCKDAKETADKTKHSASEAASTVKDKSKAVADKASELGRDAIEWLEPGAEKASDGIEDIVVRGKQVGGTAKEMGKSLADAVDGDITIKPIYQEVDDEKARAKTDAAIGDMPRVEVIDGLTIGFKSLTRTTSHEHATESGYLVVWRKGDRLIGFIYRARKRIDIDVLVAEVPRLIRLLRGII
jgi:hypothetical protein